MNVTADIKTVPLRQVGSAGTDQKPGGRYGDWRLLGPHEGAQPDPHDFRHALRNPELGRASLRDVRDAAGHADPRTRRYDRARHNLDKRPTYALAYLVSRLQICSPWHSTHSLRPAS